VPVASLVLVAVGLTTLTVAWVVHALGPSISWAAAVAIGAIVAPPDAGAATTVLREVRLPHRVSVILEGEALLNDLSALLTKSHCCRSRARRRLGRGRGDRARVPTLAVRKYDRRLGACLADRAHHSSHRGRAIIHHRPVREHIRRLNARGTVGTVTDPDDGRLRDDAGAFNASLPACPATYAILCGVGNGGSGSECARLPRHRA